MCYIKKYINYMYMLFIYELWLLIDIKGVFISFKYEVRRAKIA